VVVGEVDEVRPVVVAGAAGEVEDTAGGVVKSPARHLTGIPAAVTNPK